MSWLALLPAHAAEGLKDKSGKKIGVKTKAGAKAKANPKLKSKAQPRTKVRTVGSATAASTSNRATPNDEQSLEAEIAAARQVLVGDPRHVGARDRLARAAVVLIDMLLGAEAVGDTAKVERLSQMLGRDLHDTGWRVRKMSQKGDLKASQATGFLLAHGIFLEKDTSKACGEFVAAAEKLPAAAWHAAQCLMDVLPEKAWENMERAAQQGHAAALEWMGRRCLGEFDAKAKDYGCARDYLSQSASLGRSRAQTLLAYLLTIGQGGPVDLSRAIRLYKLAADRGDADAQNNLGEIHETGRGVDRNLDEALRWYELAALKGLGSAQFNAGRLWAVGVGEKKDLAKARAFLAQADSNGVPQARQVLDWLDRQDAAASVESPAQRSATTPGAVKEE
jgi:TPR repeat protein